jgi:hypothetical protein
VANGTDSGPKALPGSFSLPLGGQRTGRTGHGSGRRFVINPEGHVQPEAWHGWHRVAAIAARWRGQGEGYHGLHCP